MVHQVHLTAQPQAAAGTFPGLRGDCPPAAIERHAARLEPLQEQSRGLQAERYELRSSIATLDQAAAEAQRFAEARAALERAAARVYADPGQAVARIIANPPTAERRLYAGQAQAYGKLRGRGATFLFRPDAAREAAVQAAPALGPAVHSYRGSEQAAAHTRALANTIAESLPRLHNQLTQVNQGLRRLEQAIARPEKAIEAIVKEIGTQGARLALAALPRAVQLPVQAAIWAVERVLDMGRGLDLGR